MSRTGLVWTGLLVIGALGLGYGLIGRPTATPAGPVHSPEAYRPSVSSAPPAAPAAEARKAPKPRETGSPVADATPPTDPAPAPRPAYLSAETALLTESAGHQGLNLKAVDGLMKGERFSEFMDQLADQAATSPLALDITELYARSAAEANSDDADALAIRVVCGTTVCAVSATAPSKEAFDAWFLSFIGNQAALPYGVGRHDKVTASGAVEHRLVFSSDQERQHVIMPGP